MTNITRTTRRTPPKFTQIFCGPVFFSDSKLFSDPKFFWDPKFFLGHTYFSDSTFFQNQNFARTQNFVQIFLETTNFFLTQNSFGPKFSWTHNFLGPKSFQTNNFFLDPKGHIIFFLPNICLGLGNFHWRQGKKLFKLNTLDEILLCIFSLPSELSSYFLITLDPGNLVSYGLCLFLLLCIADSLDFNFNRKTSKWFHIHLNIEISFIYFLCKLSINKFLFF